MQSNANTTSGSGATISLDLPAPDATIFRSEAVHDLLSFLGRYHTDEFSITELASAVEYSQPTVSKAVDVLVANDLVVDERDGTARKVRINTSRLSRPDDPITRIPQAEFHAPVRELVARLTDAIEAIQGIVLFGSVARGDADRRSDVDCFVLVEDSQATAQRIAHDVASELNDERFDGDRYKFHVLVESIESALDYGDRLHEIFATGLPLEDSETFERLKAEVLTDETTA